MDEAAAILLLALFVIGSLGVFGWALGTARDDGLDDGLDELAEVQAHQNPQWQAVSDLWTTIALLEKRIEGVEQAIAEFEEWRKP